MMTFSSSAVLIVELAGPLRLGDGVGGELVK